MDAASRTGNTSDEGDVNPSETTVREIVHEFNNLLQTICGYTNYALMDLPADSLVRKDLDEVMIAGKRAIVLTQRLDAWRRKAESAASLEPVATNASMCACG